jgi:hypothetical protein
VIVAYFALLFGGIYYLKTQRNAPVLLVYVVVLTVALLAVVAATGERPLRWRWGRK